jgi:hypothetical protein
MPSPQEKIRVFLDLVEPVVPTAMPALIHPSPFPPLLAQVDGWLKTLGNSTNRDTYDTLRAALLVLGDDLSESHTLVQNISTPFAAAWHAVIHRREGDFWNSKYWWRRASGIDWSDLPAQLGPLFRQHSALAGLCNSSYSPAAFTDAVEQHHNSATLAAALVAAQRLEWQSLLQATLVKSEF